MGLQDNISKMKLGLGGVKPQQFGVDPVPPGSLHNTYSTDGVPVVKWRKMSGTGAKTVPSRLDIGDTKDKFKPKFKYSDNKPK